MKVANTSVPVVALKLFQHCGAGMMRTLGRLGIAVYGIDGDPRNLAFSSRYCCGKFVWDAEQEPVDRTISFLQGIAAQLREKPVLITNGDVISLLVADHLSALRDSFRILAPNGNLAREVVDKWKMFRLAKEYGVPTPETFFPSSREAVKDCLARGLLKFPVMLKGANSALLEKKTGVRMVLAQSEVEVLANYDELSNPDEPNLILQEYIPRDAESSWLFHGYFNASSDCLIGLAGRKLRQFPAYTGMTSFGVLLKNAALEESAKRFLKNVGYQGIVSMDFLFDSRDRQYKMVDVNPRIGANFRLFRDRQGLDVLLAYYLDVTGQPVTQTDIDAGRKWVVEDDDLISFLRYRRDGKFTFWKWLRSFRGLKESAWFAWDDPVPFLLMFKKLAAHLWRRLWRGPAKPAEPQPAAGKSHRVAS